jgi:flagellar basal body rod protein FlgG
MIDGAYAALSALDGFSKTMAVAANNVANASTDGFKKSRVVLEEGQNEAREVLIQEIDAPDNPISGEDISSEQTEDTSNVDIAEEMVHTMNSQSGYEANMNPLQAHEEILLSILDTLGDAFLISEAKRLSLNSQTTK